MTKVYPNANAASGNGAAAPKLAFPADHDNSSTVVLTVWKKSLLFNCDGFTVFDNQGNLVYRVDNYNAGTKAEIVLMDASGNSLLTIRRKRISLADSWLVFEGETAVNPLFSVKKNVNLFNTKSLAQVYEHRKALSSTTSPKKNNVVYEIEGSYTQRCCTVYDHKRRPVAQIKRKEEAVRGVAFGIDVFRLIVQPEEIHPSMAMVLVILLDQMFGSHYSITKRFSTC
ncbi:protein lurp-one-related 8 [Nicotiana attenuata]|uniref:Protein lurp-one-related 8 n=2 Tax=Nicotiana attenuata TaxID=49451 RepID=A0A1J6J9J9_NICAT|nr:protein lurp-one-related 8 [Nicotiana attenuata]